MTQVDNPVHLNEQATRIRPQVLRTDPGNPYSTRRLTPADYATRILTEFIPPQSLVGTPTQEILRLLGHFTAQELTQALQNIQFVEKYVSQLDDSERREFLNQISQHIGGVQGEHKFSLLKTIFENDQTLSLQASLFNRNIPVSELGKLYSSDESIFALLRVMLKKPDKFRFQAGVILSQIPVSCIPRDIADQLRPYVANLEMSVTSDAKSWFLCAQAEPRMIEAARNGMVVRVNDSFLVKGIGKLAALCLDNTVTKDGTFLAGNWYSPRDEKTRREIKSALDEGKSTLVIPGQWTLMRPLADYNGLTAEEHLSGARKYAWHMPEVFPSKIGNFTRKQIRESREE